MVRLRSAVLLKEIVCVNYAIICIVDGNACVVMCYHLQYYKYIGFDMCYNRYILGATTHHACDVAGVGM